MKRCRCCVPVVLTGLVLLGGADHVGAQGQDPELVASFIFGSRMLDCEVPNGDGESYTVVFQGTDAELLYDPTRGWGYEEINPGAGGVFRFGPFDDSPNNRNSFGDACPEQIYDSFIGGKNFSTPCADPADPEATCEDLGIEPEGIIFRADVCNGNYRFVAVVGSADNPHAHRILAENGGEGPPVDISDEHVVLVHNFDQGERGAGTFAHVGFDDYLAPEAIGPGLTSMDSEGFAVDDDDPDSPTLEVTEGYIRIHQLQGNTWTGADPNGGNLVLLELWRVGGDGPCEVTLPCSVRRGLSATHYVPGETLTVTLTAANIAGGTTITETFPEGLSVSDAGGGMVTGNTITFTVNDDAELSYTLSVPDALCDTIELSGSYDGPGECGDETAGATTVACAFGCSELRTNGAPREMLIIGPIAAGRNTSANGNCDDSGPDGNLETLDYLSDGDTGESNLAVKFGDELMPDFGGEAGGVGVADSPNQDINPDRLDGVLTVWVADTDNTGRINFNDPDNLGDPLDDYIIYSLVYLRNDTDSAIDVNLSVGSDDAVKVLVNGELVHFNAVCRGIPGALAGDVVPAVLNPGINSVLTAVVERGGGTDVRLLVLDENSVAITDGSVVACLAPEEPEPQGAVLTPGDVNGDGGVNISDAVALLGFLFGSGAIADCYLDTDGVTLNDTGLLILDHNGDGGANISDAVGALNSLFGGGDGHALGEGCTEPLPGPCEDNCQ